MWAAVESVSIIKFRKSSMERDLEKTVVKAPI